MKTALSIIINLLTIVLLTLFTSCNDWLDVKPDTEEREKDLFTSYKGYREALAGCYTAMASRSIYGEILTMSDIEHLACLWSEPDESTLPSGYYLHHHEYTNDQAKATISSAFLGLYNVIAQANKIITHIEENGQAINNQQMEAVIRAEAYALRAYCHFDVLRLFGQMPQSPQTQIRLPYAEKSDIKALPKYYDYNEYVAKLQADLNLAEELLRQYDPATTSTLESLNFQASSVEDIDDFLSYRQMRLNYWAVKGLKARFYLYINQREKAYQEAMSIINGDVGGQPPVVLTGTEDISMGYYALPGESLFLLSNPTMIDYSVNLLGGDATATLNEVSQLHITPEMLTLQLFNGQNTTSNNRYLRVWERNTSNGTGQQYPTIKKYYYDTSRQNSLSVLRSRLQVLPLIRLSEIYLIAMETTPNLEEANNLYTTYMASHNVRIRNAFATLADVANGVVDEYRREFYGEGVMFYVYKRLGITDMMWCTETMGEAQYILPLPSSEYEPE